MAVCDKWVALKIVEFLVCVSCLIAKRVSQDDEARLSLLLQKFSREWSLLTSVTWDSVGGAFADAIYGGYVIITFGLILGRIFQEVPRGRRILEAFFLGLGLLFFLVLGGLELASLDSVPPNLTVNASVLGALSLIAAALFLIDLLGPRPPGTTTHHSQTELVTPTADKKTFSTPIFDKKTLSSPMLVKKATSPKLEKNVTIVSATKTANGKTNGVANGKKEKEKASKEKATKNGYKANRPKDLDLEKGNDTVDKGESPGSRKDDLSLFDEPKSILNNLGYTKYEDSLDEELHKSKFGSLRLGMESGNYIRISDPMSELHYETELAKFNENYYKKYLEVIEGKLAVKEAYLPEPQTPVFAKVKSGRLASLYDDLSPTYELKRQSKSPTRAKTIPSPTLQQLEDYLKGNRSKRSETPLFPMEPIEEKEGGDIDRASGTPTDPGFVQYSAGKWPDKRELRTPRHSPT